MTGTTQGGKKAAATRGHDSLSEAGKKGGHAADHQKAAANGVIKSKDTMSNIICRSNLSSP